MTTTSLKISDDLKARIQTVASRKGVSSHAFMVGALQQAAEQAEARQSFIDDALTALEEVRNGGPVYAAENVHKWIQQRINARTTGAPVPDIEPVRGRIKAALDDADA